jgi:uncharacterized protein
MNLEELKESGCIIFECISGSRAYGLETPNSDTDIRGVFILPKERYYSMDYVDQISNPSNDIVFYELKKFLSLCEKNNPNILELLNVSEECVLFEHPLFTEIKSFPFLSKKCKQSFANYAYTQIKKARGLEKKIVNPVEVERKGVMDFCFVYVDGKSIELKQFLEDKSINQANCGLSGLPHFKGCFNLYENKQIPYKGIVKSEESNDISTSSIPKGEVPIGLLYFNKDGYSSYCKKYREYWDWVELRNEERFNTTQSHGKNYDSKNMMHTLRLLRMAKEIASEGKINVKRPDREFLLNVKSGLYEYDDLVAQAETLKTELDELYLTSNLPEEPDSDMVNQLLISTREAYYQQNGF